MPDSSGVVMESQVDWLTVSAHGKASAVAMLDLARGLAKEEAAKGYKERSWRLMGYEGSHVGAIEYGARDSESAILRLIGDAANNRLTVALSLADAVTRVDLAATYRATPPDPHAAANAYSLAMLWYAKDPRRAMPMKVEDGRGGATCYIGHRQSENFFRLYNKEAESKAKDDHEQAERYAGCWRYELEVKGGLAATLAERVDAEEDRATYVQRYLYQWCKAHGLEPPFGETGGQVLLPGFRRRSDADTKLRHLARNVRPTVDYLREVGRLEDAMRVLGLSKDQDA